jgi:hypothetical protein
MLTKNAPEYPYGASLQKFETLAHRQQRFFIDSVQKAHTKAVLRHDILVDILPINNLK